MHEFSNDVGMLVDAEKLDDMSSPSYIAKIIQDRLDQHPLLDSVIIQLDPIPSPHETLSNILYYTFARCQSY